MRRTVVLLCLLASVFADTTWAASRKQWNACQDNDPNVAVGACSAILDDGSENRQNEAAALANRGRAYYLKGDFDRAVADLTESIRLDAKNWAAFANRGASYANKQDFDRAIADYSESIRLNPKDINSIFNRGLARAATGDTDAAVDDYSEVIRKDPKSADALVSRGTVYLGKSDLDRAISDYTLALRLSPKNTIALNNRGNAYSAKADHAHAIEDYSTAIRVDPNALHPLLNRGILYHAKGDYGRAIPDLKAVTAMVPRTAEDTKAVQNALMLLTEMTGGVSVLRNAGQDAGSQTQALVGRQNRVALVIGNSRYSTVPFLPNAQRDAEAMAQSFRRLGFKTVRAENDLGAEAMRRALLEFGRESAGADWSVIYYAGHGMEVGGQNFLLPVDAHLATDRDVELEAISLDQVLRSVEGARKLRVVMLDACRNNPFLVQMAKTTASRSIGRGLARVEPDGATLVAYSAKNGHLAMDGDGVNSPFVQALLHYLETPGVEVNHLFRLVRDEVMTATNKQQEPYVYGSLPAEEFYFRPK